MNKKRGFFVYFILLLIVVLLIGKPVFNLVSAADSQATVSIVIFRAAEENHSLYEIFEPLCCSGGTGDWCLENDVYNETTGEGDVYCEGPNAGSSILVNVQHIIAFNFTDITIEENDTLECIIEQSDGSFLVVNETNLTLDADTHFLKYAVSNDSIITRNETTSVHDLPWGVHNCSIKYDNTTVETYEINEVIFVHRNLKWNVFDYQKAVFAESVPFKFFNNTEVLPRYYISPSDRSYMRALTFKHYAGSETEENCFDQGDNDGDGDIDDNDTDCRTFAHRYNSTMNYTIPNFLTILVLTKPGITGSVISSEDDNVNSSTLGSVTYYYNKNTDLDGSFKIRFTDSVGTSGYGYTIKNFPNVSSVTSIGTAHAEGILSYSCDGNGYCNINFDCASTACKDGASIDSVWIINSSSTNLDASATLTFESVHGTTVEEETFAAYFDPTNGLTNLNESQTTTATDSNLCDDSVNNDFDLSSDYTYITGLSFTNQITLSRDCVDVDCAGFNGPSYTAEQDYDFSQSYCEYKIETNCSDGYDNDFNNNYSLDAYGLSGHYYTDCHDVDCFGNGVDCPVNETICNDGLNNDWDYVDTDSESSSGHKIGNTDNTVSGGISWNNLSYNHSSRTYNLVDCEDPDCNQSAGTGGTCEWGEELNCTDGFNNDVLQTFDCEVSGLYGLSNNQAPSYGHREYDCATYCRANVDSVENGSECDDGVDNDFDYWSNTGIYSGTEWNGIDCGWNGTGGSYNPDTDCHLEIMGSGYRCELGTELTCNDSFSNDYDGSHTTSGGWDSILYDAYFSQFGMTYADNADCDDYDCQGVGNCPTSENPGGNYPEWCFDGADNDLDGISDCTDPDCVGARNPDDLTEVCYEYEFNSSALLDTDPNTTSYQFCGNNLDDENKDTDNGVGTTFSYNSFGETYTGARSSKMDCNDLDCRQQFGQCGPCSSVENINWDSCFDGKDNDHDSSSDSSDSDCASEVIDERGYNLTNSPTSEISCSNQYDDDGDNDEDCLDSDCMDVQFSPDGRTCRYNGVESGNCTDDFDNDDDDYIDCVDSNCAFTCGYTAISGSGITHSPSNDSFSMSGAASISGTASTIVRKGGDLYVSYSGTGSGGVTVVLGSYATAEVIDTSAFDVGLVEFVSNPNSFNVNNATSANGYLTFTGTSSGSFSFMVKIPGKNVVADPFNVTSSAEIGTDIASGTFTSEVVNDAAPSIDVLLMEPNLGNLTSGDYLQAVAGNFTGVSGGQTNSGAAGRCRFVVSGPDGFSVDEYVNDCKSSNGNSWKVYSSGTYTVQVTIYDNTGNEGNTIIDTIDINSVAPRISLDLTRTDDKRVHFASNNSNYDSFDDEFNDISGTMSASFTTDTNYPYAYDACQAVIKDESGSIVSTQDISGTLIDNGTTINCLVDARLDVLSSDGMYTLTVKATDNRGYTLETSRIVFYNCDSLSSSGSNWDCALADFDVDNYVEGVTLNFNYSDDGSTFYQLSCDSCPYDSNLGKDGNGDGTDNACDPICGDNYTEGDEECDDGNTADGDGCDSNCNLEGEYIPGGGGGGGGGPTLPPIEVEEELEITDVASFSIYPDPFEVDLKQGEAKTIQLTMRNNLEYDVEISIDYSQFVDFMVIKDTDFTLKARESKVIEVEVFALKDAIPDIYVGQLLISRNGVVTGLDTVLEIKETGALFDVFVDMVTERVAPGEDVTAIINLTNIASEEPLNVKLYYAIKDFDDNGLVFMEENVSVTGMLSIERSLTLPKDAEDINYIFFVSVEYDGKYAFSSATFKTGTIGANMVLFVITLSLVTLIIITTIVLHRRNMLNFGRLFASGGGNVGGEEVPEEV